MTTPDELRDLDRQVAEALGWHLSNCGSWWEDKNYRTTFHVTHYSPTTDARQWAVLLEMMAPDVVLDCLYEKPVRWECAVALGRSRDWPNYLGDTPGEAVVRAFLAWKGQES